MKTRASRLCRRRELQDQCSGEERRRDASSRRHNSAATQPPANGRATTHLATTQRGTSTQQLLASACARGVAGRHANRGGASLLLLLVLAAACTQGVIGPRGALVRERIPVASLHATRGQLEQLDAFQARVAVPVLRAQVSPPTTTGVELRFVYEGATAQTAPLASGELRRQLGLKLLSFDSCNVTYVMWRLAPRAQIHVSQKVNAGQTRHEECGDRGYRDLEPGWHSDALPAVLPDQEHHLTARRSGDQLRVSVDGAVVWRGAVPLPAGSVASPHVGIRSDNAKFRFSLSGVLETEAEQ
jgi:hypothetical protein